MKKEDIVGVKLITGETLVAFRKANRSNDTYILVEPALYKNGKLTDYLEIYKDSIFYVRDHFVMSIVDITSLNLFIVNKYIDYIKNKGYYETDGVYHN